MNSMNEGSNELLLLHGGLPCQHLQKMLSLAFLHGLDFVLNVLCGEVLYLRAVLEAAALRSHLQPILKEVVESFISSKWLDHSLFLLELWLLRLIKFRLALNDSLRLRK